MGVTLEQWNSLKVGDVLLDRHHRGAQRRIYSITRRQAKNSALTGTYLTVTNLKSNRSHTIVYETENTGPDRFDLAGAAP